ncbi:Cupin domain protein [Polystyrenella longa]|uniref:Cupin domain protein n=1 Tax=Polystyrenella longa TaxID=2528007 RepID=A0A518CN53_9PLAN|nr:cupin domain-containing protein [Polystyrenella longa]QDU80655.1 Cupin domain protein [Polystyrenella longa]
MQQNLFGNIPSSLPDELIETLASGDKVRVERIVSQGHHSAEDFWYDQEEAEWVLLLKGNARLVFQDPAEAVELQPGDYVLIAAHRKHRVDWTAPDTQTIWLAVFFRESTDD